MGLIEDNSDRIAHLILDEAHLEFSGLTITTANAWKPEQSGNSSGRPGGTYDLVRYVVETTEGGKLFMLGYSSPGFHTQLTGAGKLQAKEGPAGAAI